MEPRNIHRVILFSLVLLLNQARLLGQTGDTPRWEAGPLLSETTFGTAVSTRNFARAVGGRVTFNLHPIVGIEYQMAYFPGFGGYDDSKTQASAHIKLTYRLEEKRR